MRAVAACGGATRASRLSAGVHAHAHARTCRHTHTHTRTHAHVLTLATPRPTLRRPYFVARHKTLPRYFAAGQTRGIKSSYEARDHSIALANLAHARFRGRAPPQGVWLDDFQCFQDDSYYRRYDADSTRSGYLKATYTAKYSPNSKNGKLPVVIAYTVNCVPEDAEFWPEVRMLLGFAKAMTENDVDANNRWRPNVTEFRAIEFIHVMGRFHYSPREPGEPWHATVSIGNRHTLRLGYVRSSFHVYAKNENLADGYGGYSLTSLRDDANAAYRMPQSLFPNVDKTQCMDGYFVRTKYMLRNRAILAKAMNTEIPLPDGDLWDPFRPGYQKLNPGENFRTPGQPRAVNTKPRWDGDRADLIVKALQKRCAEPVAAKATAPFEEAITDDNVRSRPQSQTSLNARIQQAIANGDTQVIEWALKHYTSSEVHTIGGTVRNGRVDLNSRYKLQPQPPSLPAEAAAPLAESRPSIGQLVHGELVKAGRLKAGSKPIYQDNREWLPPTRKQRHSRLLLGGSKALRAPRMSVRDAHQHKKAHRDRHRKTRSAGDANRPQKAVEAEASNRAQPRQTKNVVGKIMSGQYDWTAIPGKRDWASPWTPDTIKHIVDGSFTPDARHTAAALRAMLQVPRASSGKVDRRKAVRRKYASKQPVNQSKSTGRAPHDPSIHFRWQKLLIVARRKKNASRTGAAVGERPSAEARVISDGTRWHIAQAKAERNLQSAASALSARWAAVRKKMADTRPRSPMAPNSPPAALTPLSTAASNAERDLQVAASALSARWAAIRKNMADARLSSPKAPNPPAAPLTPSSPAATVTVPARTERPTHDPPPPTPSDAAAATTVIVRLRAVMQKNNGVADDRQGPSVEAAQPSLPPLLPRTPSSAAAATTMTVPIRAVMQKVHGAADDRQASSPRAAQPPPPPLLPRTPSSATGAPTTSMPIRAERPCWDPKSSRGRVSIPVRQSSGDKSGPAVTAEPSPVLKLMFQDSKALRREIDKMRLGTQPRPRTSDSAGTADKSAGASVAQQPVQRGKYLDFVKGWIQ